MRELRSWLKVLLWTLSVVGLAAGDAANAAVEGTWWWLFDVVIIAAVTFTAALAVKRLRAIR